MAVATSTAILIGAALTAGTQGYFGEKNLQTAKEGKNQAKALEEERRVTLQKEAAAREAAQAKAATSGQRAGRGAGSIFATGFGFGSGNTQEGLGAGTLFGN